ncbi:MAG: MFS transporter [Microbacteriaceae bacterium]|nr:MFS transporter [Microbacteriaceae bacterium]
MLSSYKPITPRKPQVCHRALDYANPDRLRWLISAVILDGRLGDRFGRRRMFLLGLIAFMLTSVLCAVAPTIGALVALRLIDGFSAAILLPQGLGLLRAAFAPQGSRRGGAHGGNGASR